LKVPRRCSICRHEHVEQINQALVEGTVLSEIAALFRVSDDALSRHRNNHLPVTLTKAREAKEVAQADDLLGQVRNLQDRTLTILEAAEASGEHRTALAAIGEARRNLELLGKLAGELDERPQVNVLIAPKVQAVILEALRPYARARLTVAHALGNVEEAGAS
jgi:hypothetical protein